MKPLKSLKECKSIQLQTERISSVITSKALVKHIFVRLGRAKAASTSEVDSTHGSESFESQYAIEITLYNLELVEKWCGKPPESNVSVSRLSSDCQSDNQDEEVYTSDNEIMYYSRKTDHTWSRKVNLDTSVLQKYVWGDWRLKNLSQYTRVFLSISSPKCCHSLTHQLWGQQGTTTWPLFFGLRCDHYIIHFNLQIEVRSTIPYTKWYWTCSSDPNAWLWLGSYWWCSAAAFRTLSALQWCQMLASLPKVWIVTRLLRVSGPIFKNFHRPK